MLDKRTLMLRFAARADWSIWGSDERGFDENDLAGLLGILDDDAQALMVADVISAEADGRDYREGDFIASHESVLSFLEEFGEEWDRIRREKIKDALRDRIRWAKERAEKVAEADDPELEGKLLDEKRSMGVM